MLTAKTLLQGGGVASLSVIDVTDGNPFTTLVNMAVDVTLAPLLLISDLSQHTKCLKADAHASLLRHAPIAAEGDPMLTFRVTVTGVFEPAPHEEVEAAFLACHPYAELYVGFGDFKFWRMKAEHAHIIAGFGRAYSVRFKDIADITV
jgi:heme iron utilization protein